MALGLAGAARAQSSAEQAAHDLVRQGQHQAAIEAFERLYAARPEPRFLLNIAAIYKHYMPGRCPDTMRALARFFVTCPDCALRPKAEALREQAERTCLGRVELAIEPAGASVRIDDGPPQAPGELSLVEGPHVVAVTLDGHHPVERSFLVKGGETNRVEVALRPVESAADRLFVEGRGQIDDGRLLDARETLTRGEALEPSPRYALELARVSLALADCPGATTALGRFEARCPDCPLALTGSQTRVAWREACDRPAPTESALRPWMWTGLAVGLAGAAAGGVFHWRYLDGVDTRDRAQADGESITRLRALHDDATLDFQLMQAGYIAGAVGISAAVVLWWLDAPDGAGTVGLGPSLGGLSLGGRF